MLVRLGREKIELGLAGETKDRNTRPVHKAVQESVIDCFRNNSRCQRVIARRTGEVFCHDQAAEGNLLRSDRVMPVRDIRSAGHRVWLV